LGGGFNADRFWVGLVYAIVLGLSSQEQRGIDSAAYFRRAKAAGSGGALDKVVAMLRIRK
jgi:hypothetical protein